MTAPAPSGMSPTARCSVQTDSTDLQCPAPSRGGAPLWAWSPFLQKVPTTFTPPSWKLGDPSLRLQHSSELLPPRWWASHGVQNDWAQFGRYHTWGKVLREKVKIQDLIHKTWWGRAFTFYLPLPSQRAFTPQPRPGWKGEQQPPGQVETREGGCVGPSCPRQ